MHQCKHRREIASGNSLYALGGIQGMRDLDTEVYLVKRKTLYSFTPLEVKPIKTLPEVICGCLSSYYSRGTLYTEHGEGIKLTRL
jgi:hypothetical protein